SGAGRAGGQPDGRRAARPARSAPRAAGVTMPDALLRVEDLHTHFFTLDGVTRAVDGVDLVVHAGETLGIVGESGCGKSVTALSIMRLLPAKLGRVVSGTIRFDGEDLLALSEADMRE